MSFQYHSIDFLLRLFEQAITAFVNEKNKQAAKLVIIILLIVIVGTCIYDPIYLLRLIDEENNYEKRMWCIVTYPSSLEVYNYVMHTFHLFGPFMINLI